MEYTLEELFELHMGKTPSRDVLSYWNTQDNKWISIADLSKSSKYISNTKEYISNAAVKESGIFEIPADTVVMSFKLSIGKTAITTEKMFSNEAIMAFIDKKIVDMSTDYIYYLFRGKNWADNTNIAVKGKTLNKATLSKIKVKVHNKVQQNMIVETLDKAKKLIDSYQNELEQLNKLIKARFVEMFGDPTINQRGFETVALKELTPFNSINNVVSVNEHTWLLNLDMVESNTGIVIDKLRTSKVDGSTIEFDKSCVLYSKLRPYLNKVVIPDEEGFATSELISLKCDPNIVNRYYLATALRHKSFVDFINSKTAGAKMPRASMDVLRKFLMPVPGIAMQNEFADFVKQVDKSKFIHEKEYRLCQ